MTARYNQEPAAAEQPVTQAPFSILTQDNGELAWASPMWVHFRQAPAAAQR